MRYRYPFIVALLTVISGLLVIIGWAFDITDFMCIFPFWMPMKANSALCFVLIGSAIIFSNYLHPSLNATTAKFFLYLGHLFAILVGVFALLTLGEYAFKIDLGIDDWLFPTPAANNVAALNYPLQLKLDAAFPARIKLEAAACFLLLALATLIRSNKNFWRIVSASLGLCVLAISFASLSSYFSPALGQFGWFGYGIMRMNAAVLFALLGAAIVSISWQKNTVSWSLNKSTTLIFTFGLLLLVIMGFNSSRIQYWLNDTNYEIALNEKIIGHIKYILEDINNAKINTRDFATTGNKRFLTAFVAAKNDSLIKLAELHQIAPSHSIHFIEITARVNEQLQWYQHIIETRQNGVTVPNEMISYGADLFEVMQASILQTEDRHYQNILQLKQNADHVSCISFLLISLGTLLSMGIFLVALFMLNYFQSRREQAEAALHENEESRHSILQTAIDGFWLLDRYGYLRDVNDSYCRMSGYSRSELLTMHISNLDVCETAEEIATHIQRVVEQGEDRFESLHRRKDGSIFDVEISALYRQNFQETPFVFFLHDITARKQVEQELRESEQNYKALANSGMALVWMSGIDGMHYYFNQVWLDFTGRTLEQEIGSGWAEGVYPDDFDYCFDIYVTAFEQRKSFEIEYRLRCVDGGYHWIMNKGMPHYDSQGDFIGYIGHCLDITGRKQAETELQVAAAIFESQVVGMSVTDVGTKILKVNQAFCRITGYSETEVIHQKPKLLHSGRHDKAFYDALWQTIRVEGVWQGEIWNKRKNGEIYPEWLTITAVKNSSHIVTHYVATYVDITKRKQADIELQQAKEQAEAANQAKSEFLANMSHEIRTPMNAILGFSDILNHLITDPTQCYYLDAIHRSGKTLMQLINDILDLSKIEAGKFTLQYTPISVETLVNDIQLIFFQKAADKSIELSVLIDKKLPAMLLLDEIRLRQVLLNLVGNAIKFTKQGFIKILVTVNFKTDAGKINLCIKIYDSGIGIPKDQQEKIFAAFTQQDDQDISFGGTGLGLTISKRLAELMGGTLQVKSEVDKGSCFSIKLNHVEIATNAIKNSPEKLIAAPKTIQFQPAQILLVDDIKINRLLIVSYCAEFSELTFVEAETGEQALTLIKQQAFDLILMDRRLPKLNGDEVCQHIKALPDYAAIPIIMISASVLETDKSQSVFYDLQLKKPVNKNELLVAMQLFLPFDERTASPSSLLTVETQANIVEEPMSVEEKQALVELLMSDYSETINQLILSKTFKMKVFINVSEQLLTLAEQYHCSLLADWANTLKSQATLFDVTNLTKTLTGFDALLKQLNR